LFFVLFDQLCVCIHKQQRQPWRCTTSQ
jgi:hypothetical protein